MVRKTLNGVFTFLGTGASAGVPLVGCFCAVCTSKEEKNRRLRSSGLLQIGGKNLLLDVGPDFRTQALSRQVHHIDGLLLTHTHFDHIAGIDDLRIFCQRMKGMMPCLASGDACNELMRRYDYLFHSNKEHKTVRLQLVPLKENRGQVEFLNLPFQYVKYHQGEMPVLGYRIGDFAYITDIHQYPATIFDDLNGVRSLVISALQEDPSHCHFSLDEAIAFARKVGAVQTYLTHLSHALDWEKTNRWLPPNVQLGYDGQKMQFELIYE